MLGMVGQIIQYETEGFETEQEYIEFFQGLIDTGLAWTLQGSYGRAAMNLIEAGVCVPATEERAAALLARTIEIRAQAAQAAKRVEAESAAGRLMNGVNEVIG